MSTLQEFLNANPVDSLTDEVAISDRFRDADGSLLKFRIRSMTSAEFEEYRRRATTVAVGRQKARRVELDLHRFNCAMVINHTLDPNLRDAESIRAVGCTTPEEYLSRVLLPGEIVALAEEIQRLSGFDRNMDDLVDEAKN